MNDFLKQGSIEDHIGQGKAAGWDMLSPSRHMDPNRKAQIEQERQRLLAIYEEHAAAWRAMLETVPGGRAALQSLIDGTLNSPVYVANWGMPLDQIAIMGVKREGANSVAWMILKMIATGEDQDRQPKQRTEQ